MTLKLLDVSDYFAPLTTRIDVSETTFRLPG